MSNLFDLLPEGASLGKTCLATGRLAQNSGAAAAEHNRLGVAEDSCSAATDSGAAQLGVKVTHSTARGNPHAVNHLSQKLPPS
eukprot:6193927-Pleurochrysis_carterae.AAC.2